MLEENPGIINRGLDKYMGRIPGTISLYELQQASFLGMAHILRKVLSIKQTFLQLTTMDWLGYQRKKVHNVNNNNNSR